MPNKPPRNKPLTRRSSRPRPLAQLLQRSVGGGSVQTAMNQGPEQLAALRGRLVAQLPEPLGQRVISVILKPGELVVFTESAVWAARLKLALAESRVDLGPGVDADVHITVKLMPTGQFRR